MKTKAAFKKFTLMLTFVCIFTLMLICMGGMSASAAEHTDHVGYVEKTTFPTTSGSYYLGRDVTASDNSDGYVKIYSGTTLNLCLNGKTATLSVRMWIEEGATVNICDCAGGGKISASLGGAGAIIVKGNFNMTSGSVVNTGAGYGVHSHSTGVIHIAGGTISTKSYALHNAGTLYLSGTPSISSSDGSDMCLSGGTTYPHSMDGTVRYEGNPLTINDWSTIYKGKVIITDATAADLGKFTYSPDGYVLGFGTGADEGNLVLHFDFAGTGKEGDPYQVSSIDELISAITSKDNATNYIKLLNDIDNPDGSGIWHEATSTPMVLDLNGKTFNMGEGQMVLKGKATIQNGIISCASTTQVFAIGDAAADTSFADVTLQDLTVTTATANTVVMMTRGTLNVNRCTLINSKEAGYAVHLKTTRTSTNRIYCTMTNVTLAGSAGVLNYENTFDPYRYDQTIFCTVDGTDVTASMTATTYHTHGDADGDLVCDWGGEFMFAGAGTEDDPYIVTTEAELAKAMQLTVNDINYIRLGDNITATQRLTLQETDRPMVLDLNQKTLTWATDADGQFRFYQAATVKNGTIQGIEKVITVYVACNIKATVTLEGLTVIGQNAQTVYVWGDGATLVVNDCNITANGTDPGQTVYAIIVTKGTVNATNVALTPVGQYARAYYAENLPNVFMTLDGVQVTGYGYVSYHTHKDTDGDCVCDVEGCTTPAHTDRDQNNVCEACGRFISAHNHNVCGGLCTHLPVHGSIEYQPLTQTMINGLVNQALGGNVYLPAGNYALAQDITVLVHLNLSENVNLCLNGYDFNLTSFNLTGNLNICNCENTGALTFSGSLSVESGAELNLLGADVSKTAGGDEAAPIIAAGTVNVYGGDITGGTYSTKGAIAIAGDTTIGTLNLYGGRIDCIYHSNTASTIGNLNFKSFAMVTTLQFAHAPVQGQLVVTYENAGYLSGFTLAEDVAFTGWELKDDTNGAIVLNHVAHAGGSASCTEQAVCTTCNQAYGDLASHTFTVAQKDETHHWNKCANCDATDTKAEHAFGEDNVCDTCAYEKEAEGLSTGAVAGIAAGSVAVVAGGGFALFWFAIKKKTWADFLLIFKK